MNNSLLEKIAETLIEELTTLKEVSDVKAEEEVVKAISKR